MATARSHLDHILWWTLLALPGLIALFLCPGLLRAQEPHTTPRTGRHLDFEDDVNRDSVPDAWRLIAGRLNPLDPKGKLVTENPHSGKSCFGIGLDGTATTYETIEAFPLDGRFTYALGGWVRTVDLPASGLRRTRVRMEASLDHADKVLETLSSKALTGTHETWHRLVVKIPPTARAMPRKVRIRLVIDGSALTGRVWFDDVRLVAQPTIDVTFPRPSRLLTPADGTAFRVNLATLTEPEYSLELTALAPNGSKALERSVTVKPDARRRASVKAELPVGLFGMYNLRIDLKAAGIRKVVRDIRIGYLPALNRRNGRAGQFGLALSGSVEDMQTIAPVLGDIGLGQVLLKLWYTDETTEGVVASAKRLDPLLARLRSDNVQPVLALSGVPQEVGTRILDADVVPDWSHLTPARLLTLDAKHWRKPLRATAEVLGRRSGCWQIGYELDGGLKPEDPARIRKAFMTNTLGLAPRWKLGLPVGAGQDRAVIRAAHQMDFVLLKLGNEDSAHELRKVLTDLRAGPAEQWLNVRLRLHLEQDAGPEVLHADLVQRVVSGLAAGAERIIVEPGALLDEQQNIRDWLLVLATLVRELDGLDTIGNLSVEPYVYALTFSGGGRTAAVFWTDRRAATWSGYLGASAKRVDLWGNAISVADAEGVVSLELTQFPFLVTGIDSKRIRTQRSLGTSPPRKIPEVPTE